MLFRSTAPKDGLHVAILENGIPFRPTFDARQVRYDIKNFRWLGSVTDIGTAVIVSRTSNFLVARDVMEREALLGTSGGNTIDIPLAISRIVGAKFRFVKGYRGTNEVMLAMEKGEVVGLGGVGFDTMMASRGGNLDCCRVLIQTGEKPNADFPDVPLVKDLARTDAQREALSVTFAGLALGRSFVTNDIGAEKLAALRAAFEKTMADPEFRADAKRQLLPVNPMTWRESDAVIARFYAAPSHVIEEARKALAPDE